MYDELYGFNSVKKTKALTNIQGGGAGLSQVVQKELAYLSEKEVIESLCLDLKKILELKHIDKIVKELFSIEAHLKVISENIYNHISFDRFYRNISPILLQALYQNCLGEFSAESVMHDILEAIRIAVEEEYYFWQEKLLD